jgi:hypothetical protein
MPRARLLGEWLVRPYPAVPGRAEALTPTLCLRRLGAKRCSDGFSRLLVIRLCSVLKGLKPSLQPCAYDGWGAKRWSDGFSRLLVIRLSSALKGLKPSLQPWAYNGWGAKRWSDGFSRSLVFRAILRPRRAEALTPTFGKSFASHQFPCDGIGEGFAGAGEGDEPSLLGDETLFNEGVKRVE